MTFLAQELNQFFVKRGKKYCFCNGMTLNELAWEMSAQLGFTQVDPSVLSKVINGKRLLSCEQLTALCEILRLKSEDQDSLRNALQKDLLKNKGFDDFPYLVKEEADS